jgi:hypothetical protein
MKKLIYSPIEEDDQILFFKNEEELSDWVNSLERGTLFAVDDVNDVYTVMCMDGDAPWAICHLKGFKSLTFDMLVSEYELSWIDHDQMIHLIELCEN